MQELQYAACAGRQLPCSDKTEKGASRSSNLLQLRLPNADALEEEEGEAKI